MGIADLLRDNIQKQLVAINEQLEAAEVQARAHKARAEAEVAEAELEQELMRKVNDLKDKIIAGEAYLEELKDAGDEKAAQLKAKIASFFD